MEIPTVEIREYPDFGPGHYRVLFNGSNQGVFPTATAAGLAIAHLRYGFEEMQPREIGALIDAAPALLVALKTATDALAQMVRERPGHPYSAHCADIIAGARADIAAAEGRS